LLSYLTGNADTSSSIDKSAPTEMGRPRPRNETQKSAEPSALESLDTNAGAEQSERLRNLLEKGAPLGIDIQYFTRQIKGVDLISKMLRTIIYYRNEYIFIYPNLNMTPINFVMQSIDIK